MRSVKNSSLLLVAIAAIIIAGCSSSKNYYLEPEYQANKVNSSVTILPVWRTWFTNFPYHNFGSLSGTGRDIFNSSLESMFSQYISSGNVQAISSISDVDTTNFTITKIGGKKESFDIIAPKENANLNSSRFVLLLDKFYFIEKSEQSANASSYAGHEGSEKRVLYFATKYAYWDTEKKKIVGWGTSDAQKTIGQEAEYSDYSTILTEAVKKIVEQGPVKTSP